MFAITTYDKLTHTTELVHPIDTTWRHPLSTVCFVDDTTLLQGVSSDPGLSLEAQLRQEEQLLVMQTTHNSQLFADILRTLGGEIAPEKGNMYLLSPQWTKYFCSFKSKLNIPTSYYFYNYTCFFIGWRNLNDDFFFKLPV